MSYFMVRSLRIGDCEKAKKYEHMLALIPYCDRMPVRNAESFHYRVLS